MVNCPRAEAVFDRHIGQFATSSVKSRGVELEHVPRANFGIVDRKSHGLDWIVHDADVDYLGDTLSGSTNCCGTLIDHT